MMRLEGKVASITWSGRGIGQSIAELFANEGAKVVVYDKDDSCEETVKAIWQSGREAISAKADVTPADEVQRAVNTAIEKYGRIDILVNNAGVEIHDVKTPMDASEEVWDQIIDTNLKGYYPTAKYIAPIMFKNGGGVIVNISSVDGIFGFSDAHLAYNTSNAGRNMLTKVMAYHLGRKNIRVNAICPTSTADTQIYKKTPEKEAKYKAEIPLGRTAKREEVASLALFLASDECPYLNGAIITLDGGQFA
jgi:NAD(P)-dependent dehydrogenase (short-subunit alcohol dehydrogenase family)